MIDVTVPLQCLVKDSKLILTEASKVGPRGRWEGHLGKRDPLRGHVTAVEPVMLPHSLCGMQPRTKVTATLERLTSSIHPASQPLSFKYKLSVDLSHELRGRRDLGEGWREEVRRRGSKDSSCV